MPRPQVLNSQLSVRFVKSDLAATFANVGPTIKRTERRIMLTEAVGVIAVVGVWVFVFRWLGLVVDGRTTLAWTGSDGYIVTYHPRVRLKLEPHKFTCRGVFVGRLDIAAC